MTDFDPAFAVHKGMRLEATLSTCSCEGCHFWDQRAFCNAPITNDFDCDGNSRPDKQNIIWVKAQEQEKT